LNQHLFKVTYGLYPKWYYYFWTKIHLDKIIINNAQLRKLETLRDTLLPILMSGEIRVKMSEPQMGDSV